MLNWLLQEYWFPIFMLEGIFEACAQLYPGIPADIIHLCMLALFGTGLSWWAVGKHRRAEEITSSEDELSKIVFDVDASSTPHPLLGEFFHGRVHNGSSIFIKNASVTVVSFRGANDLGEVRTEASKIERMNLQWEMGETDVIDIPAGKPDVVFDIAKCLNSSANFIGFLNRVKYTPAVGDGNISISVELYGGGLPRGIPFSFRMRLPKAGEGDVIKRL